MTGPGVAAAATAGPGGGRWSSVLVALSLVMYGLIVGTVGGVVAARLAGYPVSPVAAPSRGLPRASDGLFTGLTGSGIEQAMTKAGYTCDAAAGVTALARAAVCKDRRTADYDISVSIAYQADGRVTSLTGRCRPVSGTAAVEGCGTFFGSIPGLLYPANATRARAAQDWASQNLGADTSTVIDGVYYTVQLEPLLIVCMPAA